MIEKLLAVQARGQPQRLGANKVGEEEKGGDKGGGEASFIMLSDLVSGRSTVSITLGISGTPRAQANHAYQR